MTYIIWFLTFLYHLLPLSPHPGCSCHTSFPAVPWSSLLLVFLVFFLRSLRLTLWMHSSFCSDVTFPKNFADHPYGTTRVPSHLFVRPYIIFFMLCFLFFSIYCLPLLECKVQERWDTAQGHFPRPRTVAQRMRWKSIEWKSGDKIVPW